jgi:hypothetical protein
MINMPTVTDYPKLTKSKNKALRITILDGDIQLGRRNDPCRCPIARSMQRAGYKSVHIWVTRMSFLDPKTDQFIEKLNPENLQNFIKAFDSKQKIEPTTFYI